MIKKNIVLSLATAIIAMGLLSACGNTVATEQKNEKENPEAAETTEVTTEAAEDISGNNEAVTEETSFGLQDYAGFYCKTDTEEIEDYEITYTFGYQFNGDGRGVCYGQDVIDITWNETEIHFPDNTVSFKMEPGKLTVNDIVYDKIEGNFITPNLYEVDVDNLADGIYHANIDESGITESDGQLTVMAEIYTEDSYDIVDINRMAKGDVIYINGSLLPVNSIEQTDSGILNINGGIEEGGSALIALDESNCFVFAGMDMARSYTRHGITNLLLSDNVKLIDKSDLSEEKEYIGKDAATALREIVKGYPLSCYDCSILVENGTIVEITRIYMP